MKEVRGKTSILEIRHLVHPSPWSVSISQSSSCSSRGILPSEEAASGRWGYKKKWGKLTFKCVDSFAATKDRQGFLFIELVLISIFTVNILKTGAVENKLKSFRWKTNLIKRLNLELRSGKEWVSRCQVTCAAETRLRRVRRPGQTEVSGDFSLKIRDWTD